jgi:thioredoxin 1
LAPVIDELATDFQGKVKVVKLNTDDNIQTAQQFHISGIPSLLLFKDGQVVEQMVGVQQKSTLSGLLNKYLQN